jgi:hypothetical protein
MTSRIVSSLVLIAGIVGGFTLGLSHGQTGESSVTILAATPLGDGFTYQGRLLDAGVAPLSAQYDLRFTLFDESTGGNQVAGPVSVENVVVTNGLFTVPIDFGPGVFNGDNRFMAIAIRPGASGGTFTPLTTRQQITPTPYALYAKVAGAAESITQPCPRRKYYLTTLTPNGANADTVCVAGYHFASFAEIMDPSNLEYASDLVTSGQAHSLPDSGKGPPFSSLGFIRVGVTGANNNIPGNANCFALGIPWNTSSAAVNGTAIALKPTWTDSPINISPWDATVRTCDNVGAPVVRVWCVQD